MIKEDRPVVLCAVGDISMGEHYFYSGCGPRHIVERNGPDYLFDKVRNFLASGDIVFGNLEGILSDRGLNKRDIESSVFRGSPNSVEGLRRAGFNALHVANNHMLQHGTACFLETVCQLKKHGILPVGLLDDDRYSTKPVVLEVRGKHIGFLGYSLVEDQFEQGKRLYAFLEKQKGFNDVRRLRKDVDYVVVSCHLGIEGMNRPSPHAVEIAHGMIENGASVFLGHHPHVFQKIEKIEKGIVCYSLGNFIFDLTWYPPLNWGGIVKIEIWPTGEIEYSVNPFQIGKTFQPMPIENSELDDYLQRINNLKGPKIGLDFEKANKVYYRMCESVEKNIAIRKFAFFFLTFLRGNFMLKLKFFLKKLLIRSVVKKKLKKF